MKALISIGAGQSQLPLIERAKAMGYAIIAIDQNVQAPGFSIADEKIIMSTFIPSELMTPIDKLAANYEYAGILNRSSGPPVITAAWLSDHLKIPGYPIESAKHIVNKHKLFEKCKDEDILCPKNHSYSIHDQKIIYKGNYPCIVRPSLSIVGKSGISLVTHSSELGEALNYAENVTLNDHVMISEFIVGDDVSLISFVDGGVLVPICLMDEMNQIDKDKRIYGKGFSIPSKYSDTSIEKKIHFVAQNIINVFNISRSPFMCSFRLDAQGNIHLIEIHLDIGGDLLIEKLFPNALSFNFIDLAINFLSGNHPSVPEHKVTPHSIQYGLNNT